MSLSCVLYRVIIRVFTVQATCLVFARVCIELHFVHV